VVSTDFSGSTAPSAPSPSCASGGSREAPYSLRESVESREPRASRTLDLIGVRVDGKDVVASLAQALVDKDVVASLAQALVDDVAAVVSRRPRHAGDGHALVTEEYRR
jgi:hypothetical protein